MYGARWVSVPFIATATNLFANLRGQSDTIKKSDRCQRACIHRNLFLNIIVKQMLNLPGTTDDIDKDMAHERVPRRITVPRRV